MSGCAGVPGPGRRNGGKGRLRGCESAMRWPLQSKRRMRLRVKTGMLRFACQDRRHQSKQPSMLLVCNAVRNILCEMQVERHIILTDQIIRDRINRKLAIHIVAVARQS